MGSLALTMRSVRTMSSAPRLLAKAQAGNSRAISASRAAAWAAFSAVLAASAGVTLSRAGFIGKSSGAAAEEGLRFAGGALVGIREGRETGFQCVADVLAILQRKAVET